LRAALCRVTSRLERTICHASRTPLAAGAPFTGVAIDRKETIGNSILLRLHSLHKHRYVFIGWKVYEFTAPKKITRYYSTVGNK
jgi:hypothetical protein